MNTRRTVWTEGRLRGRLVANAAVATMVAVTAADLTLGHRLGLVFDTAFVLTCLAAAFAVRPRDFFVVGVLPPLLMLGLLVALALTDRGQVGDGRDGLVQAVVSSLAHRAGALVAGYALTLAVLALRQVALRHHGLLRGQPARPVRGAARVPVRGSVPVPPAQRSAQRHDAEPAHVDAAELRAGER